MKAVPKVNSDGLYIEDVLVDDAFSGVVPFYAGSKQPELNPEIDLPETMEAEEGQSPEIAGYIVGVPVPAGLFLPRFDLAAWEAYQEALKDGSQAKFPDLWAEGLSQEEIDELTKPQPMNPSEMDKIGEQLVQRELEALELKQQNEALGGQIVGLELRVLSMETQPKGDGANV